MKEKIIRMHSKGHNVRHISKFVKKSYQTIYGFIKGFCKKGNILKAPGIGRIPLLKNQINKTLKECKKDNKKTTNNFILSSNLKNNDNPSLGTIRRILNPNNIKSYICVKNPHLVETNKKRRLK